MPKWVVWLLPALLLFSCQADSENAQGASEEAETEKFDYNQVRDIEEETKELRQLLTTTLNSLEVQLDTLRGELEQASDMERSQITGHLTQLVVRRKQLKRRLEKMDEGLGDSWTPFNQRTRVLVSKIREDLQEASR